MFIGEPARSISTVKQTELSLKVSLHQCNWLHYRVLETVNPKDSKMRVLAQTTTFWPLLSRANAVDEN